MLHSFDGMLYTPIHSYFDTDFNEEVTVYYVSRSNFYVSGSGCQQDFLKNGAEDECDTGYALKLFRSKMVYNWFDIGKSRTLAAYQRQMLAYSEDVAPKAWGLVKFIVHDGGQIWRVYWGYATQVASLDVGDYYCPNSYSGEHREYCDKVQEFNDMVRGMKELAKSMEDAGFPVPDNIPDEKYEPDYWEFCEFMGYDIDDTNFADHEDLEELVSLYAQGLQCDNKPIGYTIKKMAQMIGDLHVNNVGVINGRLVCIDFGSHLVGL